MDLRNLTLPNMPLNLIVSLVIAIVIAFAFGFYRGHGLPRLIISVLISIGGFYLGQFIATTFHWEFVMWNGVHLIEGIVGSLVALFVLNS